MEKRYTEVIPTLAQINFVYIPTSVPKIKSTLWNIVSVPAFNILMKTPLYAQPKEPALISRWPFA